MVHWPVHEHSTAEAFEALLALQQEGRIRAIGVSNFDGARLREALDTGAVIAVNQLHYSLFSRAIEYDALPACVEENVGVVGYMPLLQGILSGKYRTLGEVPWYRLRTRHFRGDRQGARHGGPGAEEEIVPALEGIRRVAEELGEPMSDVALAWVAAQPGTTCVLAGARDVEQLSANVRGCSLSLPADVIERLNVLTEPVKAKLGPDLDYWENVGNSRVR
jgi:aryl-alcohol dehydrogenase-like predicted oxidoreductase